MPRGMGVEQRIDGRRRASWTVAVGLAALVAVAWWLSPPLTAGTRMLARYDLVTQDAWLAGVLIVAWAMLAPGGPAIAIRPGRVATIVAAAVLVGGWIGARVVMARYDLSRDEQMATFDGIIYRGGHVFAAFPPTWRAFWAAVNQGFILPVGDREGWVSAYLPVNAAARAVVGVVDPTLAGPLCAAVGAIALWRIAARLWPEERETQVVVLLLYAGSSQLWITAMTAYAMSAHLAANLVWLWLFLGERRWRHGAAIAVGFLATGLHQPIFHPLFVLPFLDLLLRQRRYRLLLAYLVGYAAIGVFWLCWPLWIGAHGTVAATAAVNMEGIGYLDRFMRSVRGLTADGIGTMSANLVRFATWQHLLLVPLMAAGVAATWRAAGLGRALALGLLLPVVLLLVILPEQGLGWGYRYLHGLLGSACLLAGYGWRASGAGAPRRAMIVATVASCLIILPLHAVMAHRFVAPFAAARAALLASDADMVLVDDLAAPFVQDLVINRPDLANRPLLLKASEIRADRIGILCARGSIGVFDGAPVARLAASLGYAATAHTAALRAAARAAGCRMRPVG